MVFSLSPGCVPYGPGFTGQDKKRSVGGEKYEGRREGSIDLDGSGREGD
jgi:hypothetical protein